MYLITELGSGCDAQEHQARLFFSIYYKVQDRAFALASSTWLTETKKCNRFNTRKDVCIEIEVTTESDFRNAWSSIAHTTKQGKYKVWRGNIFSHASKQVEGNDGLEFLPDSEQNGTLQFGEISRLQPLDWGNNAALILSGCNTGLTLGRGWSPAQAFASQQKVKTLGQKGFSYFSKNWENYSQKTPNDQRICLWAYERAQNGLLGRGQRISGQIFRP